MRSASTIAARRRRLLLATATAAVALTVLVGWAGAEAELTDPASGHVLIEPGQTLWDVAVSTAPAGVDPRRQLADLRALNGIDGGHVDAWTVVLVPAR